MTNPHIKTELPGPKARAMLERDLAGRLAFLPARLPVRDVARARARKCGTSTAIASSISPPASPSAATGHAHPQVVEAIKDAADKFLHISSDYWHEDMTRARRAARGASRRWASRCMSFFCQSGTESVEGALKLARYVTGAAAFIGFLGSFHGRTMGSLVVHVQQVHAAEGLLPDDAGRDARAVPEHRTGRCFAGATRARRCSTTSRMLFERNVPPSEVAAILIEPLQGEGGYLVPPDGFLQGLRALCDEHGILLDLRRGAVGHRPHRQDVRLRALRRARPTS